MTIRRFDNFATLRQLRLEYLQSETRYGELENDTGNFKGSL